MPTADESPAATAEDLLSLLDWRRQVASLYERVRAAPSPEAGWALWRDERRRLFADHPQSPVPHSERASTQAPHLFAYDAAWRLLARMVPLPAAEQVPVSWPGGADGGIQGRAVGRTAGLADALGQELTLYWLAGYGGGLFLPFRDGTAGRETAGTGRYLLDTRKSADLGTVDAPQVGGLAPHLVLDFNFAFHPSCVYDPQWVCPLAPVENQVRVPIAAGERLPD